MRRINTLLLFAFLVNPLACLAAADTAAAGNVQGTLLAQVDQRRDDSRPGVRNDVENRVQSNRDSSEERRNYKVPRRIRVVRGLDLQANGQNDQG